MTKPYLETDPTARAQEAKELARLAVNDYITKRLPTYTPTVLRDLEEREDEQA